MSLALLIADYVRDDKGLLVLFISVEALTAPSLLLVVPGDGEPALDFVRHSNLLQKLIIAEDVAVSDNFNVVVQDCQLVSTFISVFKA